MTSLYDVSIPTLTNILKTTSSILIKGESWAKENTFPTTDLLELKVYPDMFPLRLQVIIIANITKRTMERLTGVAHPDVDSFDKTLEELYGIIDETLKELAAVEQGDIGWKEDVLVSCEFFGKEYMASAAEYVHGYAIPTVYFHLGIAYAILRGTGVPLGKWDFQTEFFKAFRPA
ncbi:hypothetical protein VP1G_05086 [Cytospora mali]|uniref:DUF1993 domain-containing protein n=1 Tax=Cytospora mali TaxID=578113 RepID=A0A194V1G3_CYTMA|nr:hypothetical protein VP1G_05086 [Valsa mali var. pyri (nom. inval.)]